MAGGAHATAASNPMKIRSSTPISPAHTKPATKMPSERLPELTLDDVDDLIYFTRVSEAEDLKATISSLAQKHNCREGDIVSAAVDPDSGNTLLHYCSANGFTDLLKGFLDQLGVQRQQLPATESSDEWKDFNPTVAANEHPINRQNSQGNTPLQWAAYNGHVEVVKVLVSAGANMWIKNAAGHLAMFEAERADKTEVVGFLLLAGGREVERKGTQKAPTEDDVADLQQGGESSTAGAEQANGGDDVEMKDRKS